MGKRCLVTGSEGFIGKKLVKSLTEAGYEVQGIDLSMGIDLSDWKQVKDIRDFDCCFHLAGRIFIPDSFNDPHSFYKNNVNASLNVLELCRLNNARIIYASTYVYGNPVYLPIDEKHPIHPANPYSQSKLLGEELCKGYFDYFGVKVLILRPFNIFGNGQNANFLIPSLISQAQRGKIILDDETPCRDFLFVDDMVEAYIKAFQADILSFEIFNIGSGISLSVMEVAKIISSKFRDVEISVSSLKRKNEVTNTLADYSKAKDLLDWEPKYTFEQAINRILAGY